MNPERMHDWLQIVGMAAVVASLIFVGLQLKQSQEIAIAGQYQARFDSASGMVSSVIQSDAALSVIGKTVREEFIANESISIELKAWTKEQPDDELAYRIVIAFNQLMVYDNLLFQYQSGFLSEEAWRAFRREIQRDLDDPRSWTRLFYERDLHIWRDSFRELMEEFSLDNESVNQ
jgi:hypothetical protein